MVPAPILLKAFRIFWYDAWHAQAIYFLYFTSSRRPSSLPPLTTRNNFGAPLPHIKIKAAPDDLHAFISLQPINTRLIFIHAEESFRDNAITLICHKPHIPSPRRLYFHAASSAWAVLIIALTIPVNNKYAFRRWWFDDYIIINYHLLLFDLGWGFLMIDIATTFSNSIGYFR